MIINSKPNIIQLLILSTIALFILITIFVVDLNLGPELSIATMYCLVVIYSWVIPVRRIELPIAVIATILIIAAQIWGVQAENGGEDVANVNILFAFVSLWISVILVSLAKKGFSSYNLALLKLEEKVQELELLNTDLDEQKQILKFKNTELEQFAYIASHDLQEPLLTIESNSHFITQRIGDISDKKLEKSFNYLNLATNRMQKLIEGLMTYSRLGLEWELEEVDVEAILQKLKSNILSDQTINAKIHIDTLPNIKGGKEEIEQLFSILLDNSVKFRKEDWPLEIFISCKQEDKCYKFCISDNGIGINPRYLERIFMIYQTTHKRKEYIGMGVGLAVAKKIVEMHNGEIWAKSELGEGSKFYFRLPINPKK